MSLPTSIVGVKERVTTGDRLNRLHLFSNKTGTAICGVTGIPSEWYEVSKKKWNNFPEHHCNRCEWVLRRLERAALRKKAG